jgi:prepilin-type N-terminal cleavage/methylation domain-containing protein
MKTKRGFTLIELMVVITIIAMLMGLLMPALSSSMATARAKKDATNLRGMGQGLASFAADFNGDYMIPGEVWRSSINTPSGPVYSWGQGDPNFFLNNTADLNSGMVAMRYFVTNQIISPCEVNYDVGVKGEIAENGQIQGYNFDAYNPSEGVYWAQPSTPGGIRANLTNPGDKKSHVSYTNQTLMGDRLRSKWHSTSGSDSTLFALRGTEDGAMRDVEDGSGEWTRSPVHDFMGPSGAYMSNIIWGDNSITTETNFFPSDSRYEPRLGGYSNGIKKDHIFQCEFTGSTDDDGNPSNFLAGDNYLSYSYLAGDEGFPNLLVTFDELKD